MLGHVSRSQDESPNSTLLKHHACSTNCNSNNCKRQVVWLDVARRPNTVCLPKCGEGHLKKKNVTANPGQGQNQQCIKSTHVHGAAQPLPHEKSFTSLIPALKRGLQTHSISIDRATISLCRTAALAQWVHSDKEDGRLQTSPQRGATLCFTLPRTAGCATF